MFEIDRNAGRRLIGGFLVLVIAIVTLACGALAYTTYSAGL